MNYKPHPYQHEAIAFGVEHGAAGFFLDPGLGKTSIIYAIFLLLRKAGLVKKMLVIAPLRPAYSVWPAEAEKWDQFSGLKVAVLHGPRKLEALKSNADVYVINPEGLDWFFRQQHRKSPRDPWPYQMLVVDESTKFKHTNTQRFKTIKPWLKMFTRRFILTGSPAPNGLLDLFGQVYLLDLGHALGGFISHYRTAFFDQSGFQGYEWKLKPGAERQIYKLLAPLVLRMDARDLLDLPPLTFNRVTIDLPDRARKQYDQMEKALLTFVDQLDGSQKVIAAANAIAAHGKCRQIANGGIFHEGGEKWSHVHYEKADAVCDLVEELQGKPALVAYEFRHDLERLQERLKKTLGEVPPYIGGGVSASRFRDLEANWKKGNIPVLLAQPQSVAHGLNLQIESSAAIIRAAQIWDLEVEEQFVRRIWRQGQREKVIVHDIIARGTVDEIIRRGVNAKDRKQQDLLSALKAYSAERRKGRAA